MLRRVLVGLFVLLAVGGVMLALVRMLNFGLGGEQPVAKEQEQKTFPSAQTAQPTPSPADTTFLVTARDGTKLRVHDFRKDKGVTQIDTDTNGSYLLLPSQNTNQTLKEQGYTISFWERAETFNITLTGEPFDDRQRGAEQELMSRLQLQKNDFCRLRFYVVATKPDGTFIEKQNLFLCAS